MQNDHNDKMATPSRQPLYACQHNSWGLLLQPQPSNRSWINFPKPSPPVLISASSTLPALLSGGPSTLCPWFCQIEHLSAQFCKTEPFHPCFCKPKHSCLLEYQSEFIYCRLDVYTISGPCWCATSQTTYLGLVELSSGLCYILVE